MALNLCFWLDSTVDDYDGKMEEFCRKLSDADLVQIAEHGGHVEHVPVVLSELEEREHPRLVELVNSLILNKKGDSFLQRWAVDFLSSRESFSQRAY
jgi:hypothetical protein